MADRTVKVTLVAQATGYIAGMDAAARKTRELGSEAERLAQKRAAFEGIGRGMLAIGVAAAIGIGFAIAKFAEFDQAMSQVNAVTQESIANQELLRDAALEAGGATVFTATEAANAQEELAKAGIRTSDILSGALRGSLDLAAAGQLEVARAAEITGVTLKQFGLEGTEAARVADVLAAGANKAVGGVEELAQGLKFVGPVADSMNVSLEDTVATLTLFADRGVLGEQAGTSLRGVLASLTSPSKEAAEELAELNVQLYDSSGRFLGLENTAGQLQAALGGVTDAERDMSLGIIFGNQQVTAARILVDAGAETWAEYREAVDDSGIAARIAAERMDNLSGDVEKLGGAVDTALIQSGSAANDVLRSIVQSLTFFIDIVGEAPEPVLAVGLAFTVAATGVTLFSGAALLAVPRIAQLRVMMAAAGISAGGLAARMIGATAALTVATLAVGFFIGRAANAAATTNEFRDSLDQSTGALTNYSRELVKQKLAEAGAFEAAREAGISQRELTDAVLEGGEALKEVQERISGNNRIDTFFTGVGIRAGNASQAIRDLRSNVVQSQKDWEDMAKAGTLAEDTLGGVSAAAADTTGGVQALSDAIADFNEQQFRSDDAVFDFKQSLIDLQEAMGAEGFTGTLDLSTQEGIDNNRMLRDLADSANTAAAEVFALTNDQAQANAILEEARGRLSEVGSAFGLAGEDLEAFINKYVNSPQDITYQARLLELEAVQQRLDGFVRSNSGRTIDLRVTNSGGLYLTPGSHYAGGLYDHGVKAFASGGFASGIYAGVTGGIHKFAESEMGVPWETYISGRPQDRARNIDIWAETGKRLGAWQAAPVQYMGTSSGGDSRTFRIEQNLNGVDPLTAAELVTQKLSAKLAVIP